MFLISRKQVVGIATMSYLEGDMHQRAKFGNKIISKETILEDQQTASNNFNMTHMLTICYFLV